ncbi:hypothetical protein ACOMHN_054929 [Nucella lapillus]
MLHTLRMQRIVQTANLWDSVRHMAGLGEFGSGAGKQALQLKKLKEHVENEVDEHEKRIREHQEVIEQHKKQIVKINLHEKDLKVNQGDR